MMKADYDSEVDALSIDLIAVPKWDSGDEVDDTFCHVAFYRDRLANVELLNPRDHLDLLDTVGERFGVDAQALRAAAQAALAAPDRAVTLEVAATIAA